MTDSDNLPPVIKIGVVGYSMTPFDQQQATARLKAVLDKIMVAHAGAKFELVSGYTACGVPQIAYQLADAAGIATVGFSAHEALGFAGGLYPVAKVILEGERYGDESAHFVAYIDLLIRVGGGTQSHREVALFKTMHPAEKWPELLFELEL